MRDRRRYYRTPPDSADELRVEVKSAEGEPFPGSILDISCGGIGIFFEPEGSPVYPLGEVVYLYLRSPLIEENLIAPASVRQREEVDGGRAYGFQFVDWLGLVSRLPEDLAAAFNRRAESRVGAAPESPIEVTVMGAGAYRAQASLWDISVTGLSLLLPPQAEAVLASVDDMSAAFRLPGHAELLTFAAKILRRDLVEAGLLYGAFFDEERTDCLQEKQRTIEAYVVEHLKHPDALT